jgi:membrane-associated protease RseP (regulator of RpoE activity)
VLDAAGKPTGATEGFLGVEPSFATPSYTVGGAAGEVLPFLGDDLKGTGSILGHLPSELWTILQGKPRNASSSALSVVGVVRVTAQIGGTSGVSNGEKFANLLLIGGELNLFVGIFNLLPLLPLDGGHIGIIGYEKLRLWLARRRGRADPGRVNLLKVLPTAYGVFGLIVAVSALLIYADIFNPVRGA